MLFQNILSLAIVSTCVCLSSGYQENDLSLMDRLLTVIQKQVNDETLEESMEKWRNSESEEEWKTAIPSLTTRQHWSKDYNPGGKRGKFFGGQSRNEDSDSQDVESRQHWSPYFRPAGKKSAEEFDFENEMYDVAQPSKNLRQHWSRYFRPGKRAKRASKGGDITVMDSDKTKRQHWSKCYSPGGKRSGGDTFLDESNRPVGMGEDVFKVDQPKENPIFVADSAIADWDLEMENAVTQPWPTSDGKKEIEVAAVDK